MTASSRNNSAPPTVSCILVGAAAPVGRGAGPMTTMLALPVAEGSASSSFFMAL